MRHLTKWVDLYKDWLVVRDECQVENTVRIEVYNRLHEICVKLLRI